MPERKRQGTVAVTNGSGTLTLYGVKPSKIGGGDTVMIALLWGGRLVASKKCFVCAHPYQVIYTAIIRESPKHRLLGSALLVPTPYGGVQELFGFETDVTFLSDSGYPSAPAPQSYDHWGGLLVSELVRPREGSRQENYGNLKKPWKDIHGLPAGRIRDCIKKKKLKLEYRQVYIYTCHRCGESDALVPASGSSITYELTAPKGVKGPISLTVSKEGKPVGVETFDSRAAYGSLKTTVPVFLPEQVLP